MSLADGDRLKFCLDAPCDAVDAGVEIDPGVGNIVAGWLENPAHHARVDEF
jgi:hypothetical protein